MAVMKAAKRQLPEEYERERNIDTALHDLFHKVASLELFDTDMTS